MSKASVDKSAYRTTWSCNALVVAIPGGRFVVHPSKTYLISVPKGIIPFPRTVLGSSPEPQIIKDPKSLYQSPSGAQGPALTQSCNRWRSPIEI